MEWIRRMMFLGIGFSAAISVAVLNDRMALNYGYEADFGVNREVRQLVTAIRREWGDNDVAKEDEFHIPQELPSLEAFVTHKI